MEKAKFQWFGAPVGVSIVPIWPRSHQVNALAEDFLPPYLVENGRPQLPCVGSCIGASVRLGKEFQIRMSMTISPAHASHLLNVGGVSVFQTSQKRLRTGILQLSSSLQRAAKVYDFTTVALELSCGPVPPLTTVPGFGRCVVTFLLPLADPSLKRTLDLPCDRSQSGLVPFSVEAMSASFHKADS